MNPHLIKELVVCNKQTGRDRFGNTELHEMLLGNYRTDVIEKLLKSKTIDVNASGFFRYSPLQLSIIGNHSQEVITAIMNHGADPNHRDLSGKTALHLLLGKDKYDDALPILQLLLDQGADVQAKDIRGQTPLHCVKYEDSFSYILVRTLLRNRASLWEQDECSRTPMHLALYSLKKFTERGVYLEFLPYMRDLFIDTQDSNGKTILHLAVELIPPGMSGVFVNHVILEKCGGSIHILDKNGQSPVDLASKNSTLIEIFTKHAFKLKCANLPLLGTYPFYFRPYHFLRDRYLDEINIMKLYRFGNLSQYSLYHIFSLRQDPIYLNNQEAAEGIQAAVDSYALKRQFPCYFGLLRKTHRQNKQRLPLLNESVEIFNITLPIEMRRMILSNLEDQDLWNVLRLKQRA